MIKYNKIFFLLFVLGLQNLAHADFIVREDSCTITNTFVGRTSDNVEYDGVINIAFTTNNVVLPLISVSLSRNINPSELSLSWPDAKLLDSRQRPLFEAFFQTRLAEETSKVFQMKKEGLLFYSQAYGFYRFQHFMALFLSQNDLVLTFKNQANDQIETQVVSLAGSDLAFRQMTYDCHPEAVTNFINTDLSRKKPVYESWTKGYGITEFYIYEDLLPAEARYPNDLTLIFNQSSDVSYNKLSELYLLLTQKADLNEKINEIATSDEFITLKESIDENANKVLALSQTRDSLNGDQGLIPRLDLELENLNASIATTQRTIQIYEQELNPLEEQVEILKIKLDELKEQLAQFDQEILQTQTENAQYEDNLTRLNQILEQYSSELSAESSDSELTSLSTPYSMEVIEESAQQVEGQLNQRRSLNRLLELIAAIQDQVETLRADHKKAFDLFTELSELKIQRVKTIEAFNTYELEKAELLKVVGGISFDKIEEFIAADSRNTAYQNKTTAEVKQLFLDSIRSSYSTHDLHVDELKSDNSNLFAKIVCKSDYFLRSFRGQCLNPSDINSPNKIEMYLDQLDSTEIADLAFHAVGRQSNIQRFESNLVVMISQKINQEVQNEANQDILKNWNQALYSRWRYFAIRSLNDEQAFSTSSMTETLNLQKNALQRIEDSKDELTGLIVELDMRISSSNSDFVQSEAEYFTSLSLNQGLILEELNRSSVDLAEINLNCLLNITNVEDCASRMDLVLTESSESLVQVNQEIKDAVVVLVFAVQKQTVEMETNLSESLAKLDSLQLSRIGYIEETNYESEDQNFQQMNGELQRQRQRLEALLQQQTEAQEKKLQAETQRAVAQVEYDSLVVEIAALVSQMEPTLNTLKPICDEKNRYISELNTVNIDIHRALNLEQPNITLNSICEINF